MNRRKAALFATNFLHYSQTFIYDEIRYHKNYEMDVFCHNRLNEKSFPYDNVYSLNSGKTLLEKAEWLTYGLTTYSPTYRKIIKNGNYEIAHAHFGPGSIYALPYKKLADIPLVVTFHGYDVPLLLTSRRFMPQFWRYWLMSRSMLKNVDRFLAASNELRDLLIELGAPKEKIRVWRLGVNIPENVETKERTGKNILMVGRFVEKKGFEYGIKGFADAVSKGCDCYLNIVGTGELKPLYEKIIEETGVADRVRFLGVMSHEKVLETMTKMDILLAPSVIASNGDRESGLIVAKEASARFMPVIGTYHGGIPEIVDHEKTGFLVQEKNCNEISESIEKLIGNAELKKEMAENGRKKMEQEYNIIDRIALLEQHYDEVIQEYKSKKN